MNFKRFLTTHFPQSNLNASLGEVRADYELLISTWLGYDKHTKQDLEKASQLAINIFEDLFLGHAEPLYALINQWDIRRDIYMFNQFRGLNNGNYEAWESFDETHEVQRQQIIIETTLDNINYKNIISKFVERDYDDTPDLITSRIFFIHPDKHMYYLYFDSEVCVGSKDVTKLIQYYHKYYRYINNAKKTEFEQFIL
ncbi:DUF3885 domain-containing protein [Parapedobacter luteus]|uniref:DUF3885 domain-containing protein n=1 Tax=Parapedobacter luteus TaxID=623280 RepID=UPI0009A88E53|nr:hypothetical protein [Parapedobacter luteus]